MWLYLYFTHSKRSQKIMVLIRFFGQSQQTVKHFALNRSYIKCNCTKTMFASTAPNTFLRHNWILLWIFGCTQAITLPQFCENMFQSVGLNPISWTIRLDYLKIRHRSCITYINTIFIASSEGERRIIYSFYFKINVVKAFCTHINKIIKSLLYFLLINHINLSLINILK